MRWYDVCKVEEEGNEGKMVARASAAQHALDLPSLQIFRQRTPCNNITSGRRSECFTQACACFIVSKSAVGQKAWE